LYLIGGPPKCGKTTLAEKMACLLSIPFVSADSLENDVMASTTKEDIPELFPHANTKGDSNDVFYSQYETERIVRDYLKQGEATRKEIIATAEQSISKGHSIIIEGHQVTPELASFLTNRFGKEIVRSIFLLKQDLQKMTLDFHKSKTKDDWILRKTKNDATFGKIAAMICFYSEYIKKEAHKHGLDVAWTDKGEFDTLIDQAIELLTKASSGNT